MRTRTCPRPARTAAVLALLVGGSLLAAAPAEAAVPGNDRIANARAVGQVPAHFTQNTTDATASRSDGRCVGGASVWYRFRPQRTVTARVVTVGSDYDTMLAVFRGPRSDRTLIRCNDDRLDLSSGVQVRFVEGRQYWIAASSYGGDQEPGGRLSLRFYRPRAADVAANVTRVEAGSMTGRLFLAGRVACSTPSQALVSLSATQTVGPAAGEIARGSGEVFVDPCYNSVRAWTATIASDTEHKFKAGESALTYSADVYDGFSWGALPEQSTNVTVVERTETSASATD